MVYLKLLLKKVGETFELLKMTVRQKMTKNSFKNVYLNF